MNKQHFISGFSLQRLRALKGTHALLVALAFIVALVLPVGVLRSSAANETTPTAKLRPNSPIARIHNGIASQSKHFSLLRRLMMPSTQREELNNASTTEPLAPFVDSIIAGWDFTGNNTATATFAATTFNANLVSTSGANNITRGTGAVASAAGNSFRTTGFQNNGISTANTDYFQITLKAATGFTVSLSAIDANFAGTATFAASPGVSSQFAYSLDGSTFTLIGSPTTTIGTPAALPQINLTGISALQNVSSGSTITLRYYASGQTTTGGWGFFSSASGINGLAITGSTTATGSTPTKLAITSISPASPIAGSGFNVTVQSQDGSNVASNVSANTGFTLSNTGGGTIGGTTTGTITAGTSQVVVTGVTLSSADTGVTLTATRTSGDTLTPGTSAPFNVVTDATFATDFFRSRVTGDWGTPATWESSHDGTTNWITATLAPDSNANTITVRNTHMVMIVASVTYDQVIVELGGQVTVASGVTHTLNNGTGTDLVISGTWLNQGSTWTINSGAAWSVSSGGTFIHNTLGGISTPLASATLDAASNFIYRGSSTLAVVPSISSRTYGNLSFESTSGTYTAASSTGSGTLAVNGAFSIGVTGAGTVSYNTTGFTGLINVANGVTIGTGSSLTLGASTLTLTGGNWSNSGTFAAGTSTVVFAGTTNQSIGGTASTTFAGLTIDNTGAGGSNTVSLLEDTTVGSALALTHGVLSVGTKILTLNGDTSSTLGTLDAANGTVNYFKSASTQNVFAADYSLLAFSGGSKVLPNGGTIGIRGTFNPGGTSGHTITNSTFDFKGTGSQTIPVFNYYNLTSSSSGDRDFGVGIVGIANVFDPGTNVYGSIGNGFLPQAGSIVEYNGSAAQTMPNSRGFKYRSLSIKNSNALGVTAPDVFGQTILISDTLFLKLGPFTLNLGNGITLANNATINRSGGTISAAPTFGVNPGDQVNVTYSEAGSLIPTGPELPTDTSKLKNLTLDNSAGVTLSVDAQVNNQLIFTNGILFSGNKILTLGSTATTTGASATKYVDGYLQKLSVTSSFKFEIGNSGYSPVTLDTVAGTGTAKVRAFHGFYPRMPNHAITLERFWNLTKDGGITSSNITFQYPAVDVHGIESSYLAYKFNGSTVTNIPAVLDNTTDPNNHTEKVLAQTSFSDWTFAELNAPTAVSLTSFDARSFADGVQLTWGTGFEVNNLGYHLYREQNGRRTRVTPSVVAGSALIVGPGRRLTAGYSYSWFDPQGTADSVYSLEVIDLDGSSQWAGPIYPYAGPNGGKTRKAPTHERAMLLNEIAADDRDSSGVSSWPCLECGGSTPLSGVATSVFENAKKSGVEPPHSKESVEPVYSLAIQQSIASGRAVKIKVRKSGWYRVTQAELVAAGFDPSSDARMLQLYVDGEEVPISLSTESTRLGPNDTMEFYGVSLDTPTTDTRVYWLVSGGSVGKRMIARRGKLKPADPNSETVSGSFDLITERREKLIYFSGLLNGDADNIFGAPVRLDPVTQTLVARNVDRESVSQPRLEVALQGFTAGTHTVQLQLNGTSVGTMTFADRDHPVAKFSVSRALLREGDNVVSLAGTNGQTDVSLIDWVRLTYPRKYKAENNTLTFSAWGGQPLRIEGFNSANVRVVDVTDPNSPMQLSAAASTSEGSYAVKVQPMGAGVRTLIAFTEGLMGHPASITANQPSNWNAPTNGADMVIIAHKDFRQAIEPLANLRRSQGLSVAVVDVEDVFDEFSYGSHTPEAIKNFLVSAAANWSRKPAYLLLVGDSSWDPRNYFNKGENDFVPTKLIDTQGMETGSDDWLADFNDLGLPNMAVGRLPARTAAEVNLMVSKIMSYEQERELNAPLRGAVMVSDNGFETQSSQTRVLLPSTVTVQIINRAAVGNDDIMRGQIVDALNQGPMIVNYFGHGSVSVWTGAGLLNSDSAGSLTNANHLSVYVMMTCLNGYATDANIDSLGEALLKAQNGGAVAVWASSGFTTPQPQFEMNTEFYRLLFSGQPMRLGDAARNAKAATSDIDVRRTWILLGDPAMRVR